MLWLTLMLIVGPPDVATSQQESDNVPTGTISGVVTFPDGTPAARQRVTLSTSVYLNRNRSSAAPRVQLGNTTTSAGGRFAVSGVPVGYPVIRASIRGRLHGESDLIRLREGEHVRGVAVHIPGRPARMSGTVVDENGAPMQGALVTRYDRHRHTDVVGALASGARDARVTRTGRKGSFILDVPWAPYDYLPAVFAPGYPRLPLGEVPLESGEEKRFDVTMRRCLPGTWTLAGTVVSAGGEPVAGAEIRYHLLVDPTDPRRRYARRRCASGANGEFLLYDLTSRLPVHVLIRHPRHGYWRGDIRGRDDQYKTRRIMLQRGADIVGEVVGPDGRPATKTHMRARFSAPVSPGPRQPEWLTDSVRTDRRARFVLRNVPPGEVELRIARDGWVDYESEALDIESSDGPVRHAIRIPASGKIVGRVIGPEGVPLPEGRIVAQRVADGGTRGAPLWIILDEDGFFESDWREPGRYRLTTVVPGFWPTVEHVESGPGPTPTETELRIGSGQTVTGTVLDVDGTPLREAAIGIYEYAADRVDGWRDWHSGTLPWRFPLARTDRLGRFTIRGVDVQRIALITGEGDELRLDVVKPAGPAGVPVQALMTAYKRHDGTYSATGGVLIQMPDEGDPAPVEIRVERPYETESLCRVTGTIHDEAGRFPEDTRLVVGVSPKITGPGSGIFSDQPPSRTQHYYVTTDPGGRYEIVSIPSGTYFLIAGSESKHFQLDEVVLAEGSSVDLGRRRLPIAGAMEGGVRGADGQPIAGGVVVAARYAENVRNARPEGTERDLIRAPIDQDGRYRFDSLDPGYWFVASVGAAHRVSAIRRAFVDGAAEIIDIRHAYTGGLQGRLVDMRTGDRLPDGTVSLRSDDARGEFSAGANADGRFALEGLPAGSYTVRPYHRECLDRPETKVEVADGETTEVIIQLRRGALTRGRIVSADGRAVDDWARRHAAELWRDGELAKRLHESSKKPLEAVALEAGTYTLRLRARGSDGEYVAESEPVTLAEGERVEDVVIELPETPR